MASMSCQCEIWVWQSFLFIFYKSFVLHFVILSTLKLFWYKTLYLIIENLFIFTHKDKEINGFYTAVVLFFLFLSTEIQRVSKVLDLSKDHMAHCDEDLSDIYSLLTIRYRIVQNKYHPPLSPILAYEMKTRLIAFGK